MDKKYHQDHFSVLSIIDKPDLMGMYRMLYPGTPECICFTNGSVDSDAHMLAIKQGSTDIEELKSHRGWSLTAG